MLNSAIDNTTQAEWLKHYPILVQENQLLQSRLEQYVEAYDALQHQVNELLRHRFGVRSEKFIDMTNPQSDFFAQDPKAAALKQAEEPETIEITAHRRQKKRSLADLNLPIRIEIIPVSDVDKVCTCGEHKQVIRYEKKILAHYQPAVHELLEQRREVVACTHGCEHSMITAPAPLHILPKAKVTEEFLSFLIVSKMDDRQPLYHLEQQLHDRYQIDLSRETMARWLIALVSKLQPLYNFIKDEIIAYDVASCDATMLQVLREPDRSAQTKSI